MHRLLMISDLHSGHLLGLTPPEYHCEKYPWQKSLWYWYLAAIEMIGPVDDLVVNGDAVDGEGKRDTAAHLTTDVRKQQEMAIHAIEKIRYNRIHIVRGTSFHVDGPMSYEDDIADAFGTKANDDIRLEIYKRLHHYRHVVGRSDTPYGSHTQIQKEVINDILQGEFENYPSADVLGRSHVHYCDGTWEADQTRGIVRHAFTSPALQLRGPIDSAFTRKLRTWKYHAGVILVETAKNGEVFIRPLIMKQTMEQRREYICLTEEESLEN